MPVKKNDVSTGERQFLLYKYFIANTNKDHPASCRMIFDYLQKHEIDISLHTLYNDIVALRKNIFDLDICVDRKMFGGKGGYYVANPPFKQSELRLMIDSVQASKFMTQAYADRISRKIKDLSCGDYLDRPALVANRIQKMSDSVVSGTDRIHEAIQTNNKISFTYFHRTPDRSRSKTYSKKGDRIIVSPYALLWDNGNYYLYAYADNRFRTYRVDRMEKIVVLPQGRDGGDGFRSKNITQNNAVVFDMYHGKKENVSFICHNHITDAIIDKFGDDKMLIREDADHFRFAASVEVSPPFYAWVATFGRSIKIISPASVVEGMRTFLQRACDMYENEGET